MGPIILDSSNIFIIESVIKLGINLLGYILFKGKLYVYFS